MRRLRDMMPGVRALAILLVFATACGGKQSGPAASGGGGAVATVFPTARFVPAQPTFVVSAKSMRDAQGSFRDIADVLGMMGGFEVGDVGSLLKFLIAVDPLEAEEVSAIGVDLDSSIVAFSEDLNPTFVVRLDSPEAMAAFLDKERDAGLRTQSVVVGTTEVFTAKLTQDVSLSWAIENEHLWLHFTIGKPDGTAWFEHSRSPTGTKWVDSWTWAQRLAGQAPALVGFLDPKSMLAVAARQAKGAADCIGALGAIERVGLTVEAGTGKQLGAKLAVELGGASQTIAAHLLAPPPGWSAARTGAPLAADLNLDLRVAAGWIQRCFQKVDDRGNVVGGSPDFVAMLDQYGVRSGRALLHSLDVDEKEGRGAIALDLSNARFIRAQLDQIPRRSMFESSRTFGVYKGTHISVPFVGAGDYVLNEQLAIAAMGDGLLKQIGTGAPPGQPPVLAIDLRPPGLPVDVWQFLLAQAGAPRPERFAQRLMTWAELHVGARLDGTSLVIEAAGTRR
jgi:hypothetical protein